MRTTNSVSHRFHWLALSGVALPIALVAALAHARRDAVASERVALEAAAAAGPRVQAVRAVAAPPTRVVTLSGEVHPLRQAIVYAKVSGYLREIHADKGDRVKANQILGVLESPETEQEAASRQADLANKRLAVERHRALAKAQLVSQQDLEKSEADWTIARAELARVEALRGYEVLRAPFAGLVTARYADPGALLQAATGATSSALPLVEVSDVSRVRVFVYLAQRDAARVRVGDLVTLWSEDRPDVKRAAAITRFTGELDPRTRSMLAEIEIDNHDGALQPGAFVRAQITLRAPPAVSVPPDAILTRDGQWLAATVRDDRVRFVPVEIGDHEGASVRVLAGLREGDVVALHVGDEVAPGAPVRAVITEPDAPTGAHAKPPR